MVGEIYDHRRSVRMTSDAFLGGGCKRGARALQTGFSSEFALYGSGAALISQQREATSPIYASSCSLTSCQLSTVTDSRML